MINCLEKFNLDKNISYMVNEFGFIGSKETGIIDRKKGVPAR